jgi:hypothetical protein
MNGTRDRQAALAALARPTWDVNHVIAYGQSLAMGYEGWPALSLTQPYDSLMLGDSVRAAEESVTEWRPVGAAAFRPLVATVATPGTAALLRPDEVAKLPPGHIAAGETVLEGAVNLWRGRLMAAGGALGRNRLLASAAGVGGRSIEALSRGASPDLFNRVRECIALARATAEAAGLTYGVVAVLFLQGEHNALGADGCTTDTAEYRARLAALHRDILADIGKITGQTAPPGFFLYQTGGTYANQTNSIARAQLEFALATPGCFMVGPDYPVPEKSGHLDANGYRWLGAQFGKALHRTLTLGQDFLPLHPLRADLRGRALLVRFHVPVPPLLWGRPFAGQRRGDPQDCGLLVLDRAGPVPLADLEQAGPDGMELTLSRDAVGPVTLRYADRTLGGRGALHDSDPDLSPDPYEFDAATGHYETANHPDLNGRPYELRNWCAAFAMPVEVQPIAAPVEPATAPATAAVAPVAAPVAPARPATQAVTPVARSGGAWGTLRAAQADVTLARPPERRGWLARLGRALFGDRVAAPPPRPVAPPAPAPPPPPPPPPAPTEPPKPPVAEAPTGGFAGIAEPDYAPTAAPEKFGRIGIHERLLLFPPEPAPPQRPAYDEANLPENFVAEHHHAVAPEAVAAYAVAGGMLWSTGLVTLGRRFVAPPDCVPGYFRASFAPTAPPLAPIHAGALGRADVRTLTLDRPVAVATHPNLGYGRFLLEVLPRLWLAKLLREQGADIPLALSRTVPAWLLPWVRLLHDEESIVWYDGAAERVRAPSIVLPGMLHSEYNFHPAMNRMVRDLLARLPPSDAASPELIYLAQSNFGDERMENAAEAEAAMRDLGFSVVRLGELDAVQQLRLFAGAKMVVAEYGDALHGALFAPPGTRVVAIGFANHCQSAIARVRGQTIAYVPPADGAFRHWRFGQGLSRSWTVDPERLRRTAEDMLRGGG